MKRKVLASALAALQLVLWVGCSPMPEVDGERAEPSINVSVTPRPTPTPLSLEAFANMPPDDRRAGISAHLRKISGEDCEKVIDALYSIQEMANEAGLQVSQAEALARFEPQTDADVIANMCYGMLHTDGVELSTRLLRDEELDTSHRRLAGVIYALHVLPQLNLEAAYTRYLQNDYVAARNLLDANMAEMGVAQVPGGAKAVMEYMTRFHSVMPALIPWLMDNNGDALVTDDVLLASLGAQTGNPAQVFEALVRFAEMMASDPARLPVVTRALQALSATADYGEVERQLIKMNTFWSLQQENPAFYDVVRQTSGYEFLSRNEAVPQGARSVLYAGGDYALDLYWTNDMLKLYAGEDKFTPAHPKPGYFLFISDDKNQLLGKKNAEISGAERMAQVNELRDFLQALPSYVLTYTGEPNEASIIITYKCSFPFYSNYYTSGETKRTISAHSFSIDLVARDAITGKIIARYRASAKPPRNINVPAGANAYYYSLAETVKAAKNLKNADAFVKKMAPPS